MRTTLLARFRPRKYPGIGQVLVQGTAGRRAAEKRRSGVRRQSVGCSRCRARAQGRGTFLVAARLIVCAAFGYEPPRRVRPRASVFTSSDLAHLVTVKLSDPRVIAQCLGREGRHQPKTLARMTAEFHDKLENFRAFNMFGHRCDA